MQQIDEFVGSLIPVSEKGRGAFAEQQCLDVSWTPDYRQCCAELGSENKINPNFRLGVKVLKLEKSTF